MSDTFYEPDQISTGDGQAGGNSIAIAGTARGRARVRKTHAQVYVIPYFCYRFIRNNYKVEIFSNNNLRY